MLFPTTQFLIFFIIIFGIAIYLKQFPKIYKYYLLLTSLIFYFSFGNNFLIYLVLNIVLNYFFLLLINRYPSKNKIILFTTILINLLYLSFFKYFKFSVNSYLFLFPPDNISEISIPALLIPVGISFYTFRVISHLVDFYKGKFKIPPFIEYANYISFFPQIVAGPINRAEEFYIDLRHPQMLIYSSGKIFTLIISGILKKYVIASFLFSYTQGPFSSPGNFSSIDLIIGALAYSIMIYADFSGYSDFAIATSTLLGIKTPENFLFPYKSRGINEFWDRWHISLSTWLRDYVYIPLGGNRKGLPRKYLNIFITLFISGLWHGAGVQFMFWGILHGLASILNHTFTSIKSIQKFLYSNKYVYLFSSAFFWLITFIYVSMCWIFFNSPNIQSAFLYISRIFTSEIDTNILLNIRVIIVIIFVLVINIRGEEIKAFIINFFDNIMKNIYLKLLLLIFIVYLLISLGPTLVPPFVYFNF